MSLSQLTRVSSQATWRPQYRFALKVDQQLSSMSFPRLPTECFAFLSSLRATRLWPFFTDMASSLLHLPRSPRSLQVKGPVFLHRKTTGRGAVEGWSCFEKVHQ